MTTDEYFDLWLKEQEGKIKARTLNRYAELIATHIKPSFEGIPIKKVTKDMIERYVAEYLQAQAGLADNSVLQIMGVIKRAFKQAVIKGIIRVNPTLDISLKHRQKKIDAFTEREQRKLERFIISSGRARYYGILIALYTGLRIGELLALTWDDVDMRNATLSISKTVGNLRISKGQSNPYLGTPKTAAGVRVIPYPKQLTPLFRLLKSVGGASMWCLPSRAAMCRSTAIKRPFATYCVCSRSRTRASTVSDIPTPRERSSRARI